MVNLQGEPLPRAHEPFFDVLADKLRDAIWAHTCQNWQVKTIKKHRHLKDDRRREKAMREHPRRVVSLAVLALFASSLALSQDLELRRPECLNGLLKSGALVLPETPHGK
jgi:hypothetical protein